MSDIHVCICGGGRIGHLSAVLFKGSGARVTVLTSDVVGMTNRMPCAGICAAFSDGTQMFQRPDTITSEARQGVLGANIIALTVPAHVRPSVLRAIAPYLHGRRRLYVGSIPGNGGFDWMARRLLPDNCIIFGLRDTPNNAYNLRRGVRVDVGIGSETIEVAYADGTPTTEQDIGDHLLSVLFARPIVRLESFLEVTLSLGNPILHVPALYSLIGPAGPFKTSAFPKRLHWWHDLSIAGARYIEQCVAEQLLLVDAYRSRTGARLRSVKDITVSMRERYGGQIGDSSTLYSMLRTNKALKGMVPLKREGSHLLLDQTNRIFTEDTQFGIRILRELADRAGITVALIEEIDDWSRELADPTFGSAVDYLEPPGTFAGATDPSQGGVSSSVV
ncbi:NAD/NADP octopine/nopaline dehydrogenase family protein [Bradyrhizobium sp. WSM2254]|uniref:NAD/NADP octopine/nopaline dehydrogenase family protein n=1 Tax=Bradyrhizobium sp. WSM2254 TaxID=1188263 RepID=UPI00047F0F7B|nr:NAD/NADP octopine/nopaline dehydrogenase family protein [Bradyrhizobium sp. WSM2254]